MTDEGVPRPDPEKQELVLKVGRETLHLFNLLVEKIHPFEETKKRWGHQAQEMQERHINVLFASMVMGRALKEFGPDYQQVCEEYRQEQWRREKAWAENDAPEADQPEPSY